MCQQRRAGLERTRHACPLLAAYASVQVPHVSEFDVKLASSALNRSAISYKLCSKLPMAERATTLRRAADALQAELPKFSALLVKEAVKLLHAAGVPEGALQLLHGPIVPLIAETGGINAMLVDSTALPEQVSDAVMQSAFRSAGQRCSALRLLCVHEDIADKVIAMISGAAKELVAGDPADLATDVGPVIDREAFEGIQSHLERLHREAAPLLAGVDLNAHAAMAAGDLPGYMNNMPVAKVNKGQEAIKTIANLIPPQAFEVASISDLKAEIFGLVLHVVRWKGDPLAVIEQINVLGYGLTIGIQTRIDSRAQQLAHAAHIGNVYINRNQIGVVVGVQPFGGEGLSGTGPKAGGPHYLVRFCAEQTVTINTTAAGGNAALLAG